MLWTRNQQKYDRISRFGETVDLPLFNQPVEPKYSKMPNWLANGNDIKAQALELIKGTLHEKQTQYLLIMLELGGEASDHDVKTKLDKELGWISARRNALKELGIIESAHKKKMGPCGISNSVWRINFDNLREVLGL